MASVFKLNSRGVQDLLDGGGGVEAELDAAAQAILAAAKASAPVESGAYRDSLHIETDHTDRIVKRVIADVPYGMVVEANTGVLARSIDG